MNKSVVAAVCTAALGLLIPIAALGAQPESPEELKLFVFGYNDKGHVVGIKGAVVDLVQRDAVVRLGETDSSGMVTIPVDRLADTESRSVLICSSSTSLVCSALRLDRHGWRGFRELNLTLASAEILDRGPARKHRE